MSTCYYYIDYMDNYTFYFNDKFIIDKEFFYNFQSLIFTLFIIFFALFSNLNNKIHCLHLFSNNYKPINYISCSCQKTCSICLSNIIDNNNKITTVCGHVYHSDCFIEFILKTKSNVFYCPMCRHLLYDNSNFLNNNIDNESEDAEDSEDAENAEDAEDAEDAENSENAEDAQISEYNVNAYDDNTTETDTDTDTDIDDDLNNREVFV